MVVTRAPLFTQKGELFPGAWFAVGHDTAVRLVMPKYYGNSEMEMVRQFTRLRASGSRFVVGGRVAQVRGGGWHAGVAWFNDFMGQVHGDMSTYGKGLDVRGAFSSSGAVVVVQRAPAARCAQGKSIGSGQGGTAFLTLDDVEIPNSLEALDMFVGIGEREFRRDISSTELRQSRGPLW